MLTSYRVIDLTVGADMFCGYLLSHLGAEVISIRPPQESFTHPVHPTLGGSDRSLWWEAYARGRTHVDLDVSRDRRVFDELVLGADIVVHGFTDLVAAENGLAYEVLNDVNPSVIVVAITAFGASGPKAEWPATDLTVWASSGAHFLAGDADRAPVRTSVPQAFFHAGADAFFGDHRVDGEMLSDVAQEIEQCDFASPVGGVEQFGRVFGGLKIEKLGELRFHRGDIGGE